MCNGGGQKEKPKEKLGEAINEHAGKASGRKMRRPNYRTRIQAGDTGSYNNTQENNPYPTPRNILGLHTTYSLVQIGPCSRHADVITLR